MPPPVQLCLHARRDLLSCYPRPVANTSGGGTHVRIQSTPQNYPRMNPRDCRNRAAIRDPGAMGIPYRRLGLITLAGTPRDTSLLYAATRG